MHRVNIFATSILIICAGLIQAAAFDHISLFGVKPDLLLIITIFLSLSSPKGQAIKTAAAAGFIKDITSSSVLGSNAVSFLLMAVFMNYHQRKFYRERAGTQILITFLGCFIAGLLVIVLNIIAGQVLAPYRPFLIRVFKGAVYTGIISPLVFLLLSKALRVPLTPGP